MKWNAAINVSSYDAEVNTIKAFLSMQVWLVITNRLSSILGCTRIGSFICFPKNIPFCPKCVGWSCLSFSSGQIIPHPPAKGVLFGKCSPYLLRFPRRNLKKGNVLRMLWNGASENGFLLTPFSKITLHWIWMTMDQ